MAAYIAWLLYAGTFYIAWTLGFRWRYRRWPVAYRLPPRHVGEGLYTLVDLGLNLSLVTYTLWLLLGPPVQPVAAPVGILLVSLGAALRLWTLIVLGRNWRMGQDDADPEVEYIARGPYRLLSHPINLALILVALGLAFLTGFDSRAWFLITIAVVYYAAQARAEIQFWRNKTTPGSA